jgi:hypothetical protein
VERLTRELTVVSSCRLSLALAHVCVLPRWSEMMKGRTSFICVVNYTFNFHRLFEHSGPLFEE